jgi:hypothetical protein
MVLIIVEGLALRTERLANKVNNASFVLVAIQPDRHAASFDRLPLGFAENTAVADLRQCFY